MEWYGVDAGGNYTSYIIKSTDNGATWGTAIAVITGTTPALYTEASFVYLGGSTILGLVRNESALKPRQVLSIDNGATWTNLGIVTWDMSNASATGGWLSTYIGENGRRVVEYVFHHRGYNLIMSITGYASDLIANGISGWKNITFRTDVGVAIGGGGYPTVVHPFGNAMGLGWYYEQVSPTHTLIKFFLMSSQMNNFSPAEGNILSAINLVGGTWGTIDSKVWKCIQTGKKVDLWIRLESTTAGSGVTAVYFNLPVDVPAPAFFSNVGTNETGYVGSAFSATSITASPVAGICSIANTAGVAELDIYFPAANCKVVMAHITYFTE